MHELLQHYQILERLRRATKGGEFSRAACREFAFVLNLRQREIPKQKKLSKSLTSLQYLLNFASTVGNLKCFNGHENRSFCSTMTNYIAEIF